VQAVLSKEMGQILSAAEQAGWVVEPEAKRFLSLAGIPVPRYRWVKSPEEGVRFAAEIGYPVAAKVVSCEVLHKSDEGGVILGIDSDQGLRLAYDRFSAMRGFAGMLVEEMVPGMELILGAKIDYQFGPVILMGVGGTGVEIYKDVALRMAPLKERDVESMVKSLKAHQLLEGYRGSEPVDLGALSRTVMLFSQMVMDMEKMIESIDLNPVKCSSKGCIVADARIMLAPPISFSSAGKSGLARSRCQS
jgi:acyl-CoA synthetase (NDP forming)